MAKWLAFHPIKFIPEINSALFAIVCKMYPNYKEIQECFVRIYRLPVADSIMELSYSHLGKLVKSNFVNNVSLRNGDFSKWNSEPTNQSVI